MREIAGGACTDEVCTWSDEVWIENQVVRNDAAAGDEELVVAAVPEVLQRIDSHKHDAGVSLQGHQSWNLEFTGL